MSFDSIEEIPLDVYLATLLNDWEDDENICPDCGETDCDCDEEDDFFNDSDIEE